MSQTDKTIPLRLSPAELENLRILRRRTNPAIAIQDEEQKELDTRNSNLDHSSPKTEKKIPREQP